MRRSTPPTTIREPIPITEMREVILAWNVQCVECGDGFIAKRIDAKTCGSACRMSKVRREREGD